MKNIRTIALAITASAAAMAILSGCTPQPEEDNSWSTQTMDDSYVIPSIYLSPETGAVTKITDDEGVPTFEEGYTTSDVKFEHYGSPGYGSYTFKSNIVLEGNSYPVSTALSWQSVPVDNRDDLITFYNQNVATPFDPSIETSGTFSVTDKVVQYVFGQVNDAYTAGTAPIPQFSTTGRTSRLEDSAVADAWRAGIPAWQFNPVPVSNTNTPQKEYNPPTQNPPQAPQSPPNAPGYYDSNPVPSESQDFYSFTCAIYEVAPTNGKEVRSWAETLSGAQFVEFSGVGKASVIAVQTEAPCAVKSDSVNLSLD